MPLPQPAAQDDTLSELLELINRQLTEKGLKVEKASAAVIDATIIETAGSKQRQAIEVDEEGQVSGQTTPSKDKDARWTKKNGIYKLGYKQHTRTDEEGYIEKLHITPANTHECNHLSPLLEGIADGTTVYADKGYDSAENRQHLKEHQLLDGIMRKAHRNRPLTETRRRSATDICRRPVMWSNKASVRYTVNSATPGQPILVCVK